MGLAIEKRRWGAREERERFANVVVNCVHDHLLLLSTYLLFVPPLPPIGTQANTSASQSNKQQLKAQLSETNTILSRFVSIGAIDRLIDRSLECDGGDLVISCYITATTLSTRQTIISNGELIYSRGSKLYGSRLLALCLCMIGITERKCI